MGKKRDRKQDERATNKAPEATPDGSGRLVAALLEAQQAIQGVAKDGENTFHNYKYVSAESMFRETRKVLADAGVSVLPLSTSIRVEERSIRIPIARGVCEGVEGHGVLCRRYLVSHASGQSLEFSQEWPIVPENGRPLDKATGAADTASLSYFLRDLLLIPRVEQGTGLDGDDRDEQPDAPPMATQLQGRRIGEQLDRLRIGFDREGDAAELCRARAVGRAAGLTEPVFPGSLRMADAVRCLEVLEAAETPAPAEVEVKVEARIEVEAKLEVDTSGTTDALAKAKSDLDEIEERNKSAASAAEEAFGETPPAEVDTPPAEQPEAETNTQTAERLAEEQTGVRITPMQSLGIRSLFNDLGVNDGDHRRRLIEHIVDRSVSSTKDLTAAEAQKVLDRLTNESNRRDVKAAEPAAES